MKNDAAAVILGELKEIERLLIVQQWQTDQRFDEIEKELMLICRNDYISAELERAVKKVAFRTLHVDRKVGD